MKEYIALSAALIAIPLSIMSTFMSIRNGSAIDKLVDITARQHDVIPEKLKQNKEKYPFVRRTIHIKDVSFNESGNATVKFKDSIENNLIYSQTGCPSIAKHIDKKFDVDYNTLKNSYAISCDNFKVK